MWIILAFVSALFAGITAILAKIGVKNLDSTVATAYRTAVVLIFAWLMVLVSGAFADFSAIGWKSLLFLILSGLATGGSWLCYFKALKLGEVSKVAPVDKSSTILTMLFGFIFFNEFTFIKLAGLAVILVGTALMSIRKDTFKKGGNKAWFIYAALSAAFAALTAILGKVGVEGISSTLGTAIRTIVVLIMSFAVVFIAGKRDKLIKPDRKSVVFLVLSGIATGLSWLAYYKALQDGDASVVAPIDKLSILITVAFSYFILKEKIGVKALCGLALITGGTLILLI